MCAYIATLLVGLSVAQRFGNVNFKLITTKKQTIIFVADKRSVWRLVWHKRCDERKAKGEKGVSRMDKMLLNKNSNEDSRNEKSGTQRTTKCAERHWQVDCPCWAMAGNDREPNRENEMRRDTHTPLAGHSAERRKPNRNSDWIFVRLFDCKAIGCDGLFPSPLRPSTHWHLYSILSSASACGSCLHRSPGALSSSGLSHNFSVTVSIWAFSMSSRTAWNTINSEKNNKMVLDGYQLVGNSEFFWFFFLFDFDCTDGCRMSSSPILVTFSHQTMELGMLSIYYLYHHRPLHGFMGFSIGMWLHTVDDNAANNLRFFPPHICALRMFCVRFRPFRLQWRTSGIWIIPTNNKCQSP